MNKRTSKMSPGEQRRSTILARISYYKEDAIIKLVCNLIIAFTVCRFAPAHKVKIFFGTLIVSILSTLLSDLIATGLYMLYFEVAKFGWPKEKSWIKFRKIINYISLAFFLAGFLGINIMGGMAMAALKNMKAQQVVDNVANIPDQTFRTFGLNPGIELN